MINFLHPFYFLILIPLLLILLLWYFKGGTKIHFGPIDDLKHIFKRSSIFYKLYFLLIFLVVGFYITIFAKPVEISSIKPDIKNGIDIQIILDVSYSMIAEDMEPNRLQVAKDVINGFLNKVVSDRIGIIVFAGKTFTSLPLNFDYNIIKKVVAKISMTTINQNFRYMQGTAMGDALILATDTFDDSDREKVIILLTDGEANKGIDPIVALKYLKTTEKNIKVYTIGLGGDKPTYVKIKNHFGGYDKLPIGGVDEKTLKEVADITGGKYFRAGDKKTLESIFSTIGELEKKDIKIENIVINNEKYNNFVYLLVLFFSLFLSIKYFKRV